MKFDSIEYLKSGNKKQRQAYSVLTKAKVLSKLKKYDPILVGTIPINIDIETSDLDISCCFSDKEEFIKSITCLFHQEKNFRLKELVLGSSSVVVSFVRDSFEIEIFAQDIPTKKQYAYRHMLVEYDLLKRFGADFRQRIVTLKQQGYKTEPAFGVALGLKGDPYQELLNFEQE